MKSELEAYEKLIDFLEGLKQVDDSVFFAPIAEQKWSVAAIIAHLLYWDRYFMEERLPDMSEGRMLPKSKIDPNEMNRNAQQYAHSGISKIQLIDEVIQYRIHAINRLRKADMKQTFYIGDRPYTLEGYIRGLSEHDDHHKQQIQIAIA